MSNVEIAKNTLLDILESPETPGLEKAAQVVLESGDPRGLELLAAVLELTPRPELLEPLWTLANDGERRRSARSFALQAITSVLVSARIALERDTEANLLTRLELDAQIDRLMAYFADETHDEDLRRRALEMAANTARRDDILKAGQKAVGSEDGSWAATGLFVCRIIQPERAREFVEKALEHPSDDVRYEAIAGLAELGTEADYERLKDFVYDGSSDERSAALWALVELPDERAGNTLIEATRWLHGQALYEAQDANSQWLDRWSDVVSSGAEVVERGPRVLSRRGLDRYLSDDFLLDDDDDGGGFGDD